MTDERGDPELGGQPLRDPTRPTMRLDVVAAPVRYPLAPLLGLVVLALVPLALLSWLLVWADQQADAHEQQGTAAEVPTAPPVAAGDADRRLATPVLSYRRIPASVAALGDDRLLAESMDQLYAFMGDGSCAAVSVDGRLVSEHNATTPVIPASNQKLLVGAVALEVLGADHRFVTSVAGPAPVDGVIDGDLYLVGGGDPVLTSDDYPIEDDRYPAFGTTSLDALADAVAATGVTSITGDVVGDGGRYDDEWYIESWGPDVRGVDAGPYDALMVNDARVLGRSGRESDPNSAAAREFVRLLGVRGITVADGWDAGATPPGTPVIATIESAPLESIVAELLVTSDNDTAELLLKELGVAGSGEGTVAGGLNVVDRTLRSWGVPMEGVRLADASGLSTNNRLTCAAIVAVLDRVADTELRAALPVAATNGTLVEEFVGSPVAGRLAAKTGTLGNPPVDVDPPAVKALAGYLDAEGGASVRFALVLNAPNVDDPEIYRTYWAALADRLAAYPAGPGADPVAPR
jgi:D-alanyl-D-alanine carboxypeptidase/D-alanyl-D-alanine-endopeptidase (penicillin-binding protein 4)